MRKILRTLPAKAAAGWKQFAGILAGRTSVLVRKYKKRKVTQKIISRLSEIVFSAQKK
ncbi:hypothetical protein [Agathobaculum butyriciproducens]|uniref:hypothetical protein n=1 Tax=Agathobaculum butyriciproducens TaxID=1628085 RepID=UPI003AF16EC2